MAIDGKATECAAFRLVTHDLEAASAGVERIRALGRNHLLWSILVKDMSLAGNSLPVPLKEELIGLGLWSMRYSTLAVLRDLPVEPLVSVNQNVLSGILLQQSHAGEEVASRTLPTHAI